MTLLNIAWLLIAVMILVAIANAYFHKYDRVFSNAFNIIFSYLPTLWLAYKHKINRAAWYCVGSLYITILLAFFLRLATGHETDLDLHITGLCIMSLILLDGKASLLMALLTAFTYFLCRVLLIYYILTPFEIGHFVDGTTVFSLIIYFGYIVRRTALKMQREISEQNYMLINANSLKDKLFGIIGHDLLHNAIKFTPAGGSIHVSTGQHDHTGWLRITDSGVGMPISRPASLSGQVIPSRGTAGEKGTGLGLELCREFMRLNQGELLIDSQMGKGTNVTARFDSAVS
ncbi:ATP-binding protein [Spirosoma linguale]|uniref:histidine kinase n=1 Tax=Spirosoma linguale (strain ATCC 33905 / DSM 74 / LMG 10896 / Claus 1) TaxID=504472 RepID=D2QU98_SPILD|nr:histidine kinase [Spirosoma linguale DSM 74]